MVGTLTHRQENDAFYVESPIHRVRFWGNRSPKITPPNSSLRKELDRAGFAPRKGNYSESDHLLLILHNIDKELMRNVRSRGFEALVTDHTSRRLSLKYIQSLPKYTTDETSRDLWKSLGADVVKATWNVLYNTEDQLAVEGEFMGDTVESVARQMKLNEMVYRLSAGMKQVGLCGSKKNPVDSTFTQVKEITDFKSKNTFVGPNHAVKFEDNRMTVLASVYPRRPPPPGARTVVYKSLKGSLACLLLPQYTWTNNAGTYGKFRAEKLYVVRIVSVHGLEQLNSDVSYYNHPRASEFTYAADTMITTPVNYDPNVKCGMGLHFFLSLEEANEYYHNLAPNELATVRDKFEEGLSGLDESWIDSPAVCGSDIVPLHGSVPAEEPEGASGVASGDIQQVQQPESSDEEISMRRTQIKSFRARLDYSTKMFDAHCESIVAVMGESEKAESADIKTKIAAICEPSETDSKDAFGSALETTVLVFMHADTFREKTLKKYVNPNISGKQSSLFFSS